MTVRSVVATTLVLLGPLALATAAAGKPQPWKPATPPPAPAKPRLWHGRPVSYIDGVPDTGQFLPDSAVLGHVNERVFHVGDFRNSWFASYAEYRPKPDSSGRAEFLNSMVNKEVLALTALQLNRPFDFEDRAKMREHVDRVLSNIAFQRLVADSARPSEDEIRSTYEQNKISLHLQHLVVADRATADRVSADLAAGRTTWSQAVKKYTVIDKDRTRDGDLSWQLRSGIDPVLAPELYALKNGQFSRPSETTQGWEIVRVVERRAVGVAPLESMRSTVISEIQPLKIAERVEHLRAFLRKRIGVQYNAENIRWTASLLGQTAPTRRDEEGQTVLDLSGAVPDFQPEDTSRVLAQWNDGRFTVGMFLADYKAIPVPQRMNVNTLDTFRNALDGFVLEPYTAQLARERGLDKDPAAIAMIERKREEILVEHLYGDSIQSKVFVSQADRKDYYQKHLPEFFSFSSVRFAAILRHSIASADSLVDALNKGARAEAILRADSLAGHPDGSIKTRREDEKGEYYKLLFEELKPGQAARTGVDKVGDVAVIQLLEHDPGHQLKLEEVESIVDESLQNIRAEALLKAFIARHRGAYSIDVHPELVERIKLTDPVLD